MGFKIGIMGTGRMARRMADTISRMQDVDLYAVASRTEEQAKSMADLYHAECYYGSYEALTEDAQVELIYIATPNHMHYAHARECIRQGKAVLLEKPFTLNEQQAQALIDLAQMHQVFLCEAMWVRFMPLLARLKKELDGERIGEIISVTADMGYDLREKERVNRLDMGGGALLDIGVYPLSFAISLIGMDIENISTSMVHMPSGVDAQEFVNLTYSSGTMAGLFVTMLANTPKKGVLFGTEGRIEVDDLNNYMQYRVYDREGSLVETVNRPEAISGLEYEVEACVRAIRAGKKECPEMTHFDTLFQLRVMDTVRRAWNMTYPQEDTVQ